MDKDRLLSKLEGRLVGPFQGMFYLTEHDHEVLRPYVLEWYTRRVPQEVNYAFAQNLVAECADAFQLRFVWRGKVIIPSDFTDWLFNVMDMMHNAV